MRRRIAWHGAIGSLEYRVGPSSTAVAARIAATRHVAIVLSDLPEPSVTIAAIALGTILNTCVSKSVFTAGFDAPILSHLSIFPMLLIEIPQVSVLIAA